MSSKSTKKDRKSGGAAKDPLREAASLMGQKGGPLAAKARFSKMTAEERSEHGRRLTNARWAKRDEEAEHD